jgi:MFS family permease
MIASLLSALDVSVISTAMPSMVHDLGSNYAFIWIANAYFLTMTAFQPIYGQTANIFGRRSLTLLAVSLFAIGSAVSGSAPNLGALIVGRAIQGIGGGGINILIEIVVADLLPLRQRPKFISIIFTAYTVAVVLGPVIGGLLSERVTWRWIFYLNLPVSGVALIMLFAVLRVQYKKDSMRNSLKRVDFGGNALLIASVVSVLLALTWGGVEFAWSSWRTILPLILGVLGIGSFIGIESTQWIPEPTMPIRLFSNRTSLGGFAVAFIHSMLTYWITYFM